MPESGGCDSGTPLAMLIDDKATVALTVMAAVNYTPDVENGWLGLG
ncbi:hypothetical protein ACT9ST_16465 [Sphingobium limneticum]